MLPKKLTILVAPLDAYGHFNASIGLAEPLRDRGHNVVFAVPNGWKGKLEPLGFGEEWYSTEDTDEGSSGSISQSKAFCDIFSTMAAGMARLPYEQIKEILRDVLPTGIKMTQNSDKYFNRIIAKVKPDVIVVDTIYCQPAVVTAGIPWILSASISALGITKENSPPAFSGLSINGNRIEWKRFEKTLGKELEDMFQAFNSWCLENGAEPITKNYPFFINDSPYANIYMCPKELDYTDYRPNPPNWHHFDTYIRNSITEFQIPTPLKALPGKLVYFSMGSLGSSEVGLMNRLVKILGKSHHRFIVSKGVSGDEYELPANMWGANMVPQTKVLPLVDLVITHGGNNTVTESFYFGKPCIVLPLFADQHDNAQRIQELGLGLKFPPYQVTEEELLSAIDRILADRELANKMQGISKRIQAANSKSAVADLIEKVAWNNCQCNGVSLKIKN